MGNFLEWWEAVRQSLADALNGVGAYLPLLLAAFLVMLAGWLVAKLLRAAVRRLCSVLSHFLSRFGQRPGSQGLGLSSRVISLLGNIAFWVAILVSAAIAARVARLEAFSTWLGRIVEYLPTLIAGGLISLAGYLLSTLVRDAVAAALASPGSDQHRVPALIAQGAVFITAIVVGLDQVGVDVTFLITLAAVLVGGALIAMALAFGFGARDFVANVIAAHHIRRTLEPGDYTRVGEVEGRILEITPTSVILLAERGRVLVPAKLFQEQITQLAAADDDE
jgi:small-conductance mechanosensitive channel